MRKISYSIILSAVVLSGCFGFGDDSTTKEEKKIEGYNIYSHEEFEIQVPAEWETVSAAAFKSTVEKNTIVAFRSNVRDPKFTPNVAIVKNELTEEIGTPDYAKALRQKIGDDLSDTQEINFESHKIIIGEKETDTFFFVLKGRESAEAESKNFVAVAAVKEKTAYIAIGSFLAGEDEGITKKIETMVKSFEVK